MGEGYCPQVHIFTTSWRQPEAHTMVKGGSRGRADHLHFPWNVKPTLLLQLKTASTLAKVANQQYTHVESQSKTTQTIQKKQILTLDKKSALQPAPADVPDTLSLLSANFSMCWPDSSLPVTRARLFSPPCGGVYFASAHMGQSQPCPTERFAGMAGWPIYWE